jgi:phosphoadenosine phosphosulfate reductase
MRFATPVDRIIAAGGCLRRIAADHAPAALACSFGAEDMVLVDLIARDRLPIGIFSLDTGRLPEETHALIDRVRDRYGLRIDVVFPDARAVEALVAEHGANGFYRSSEVRMACCRVRKVEPLARALAGKRAWITGLRREQSANRAAVEVETFDDAHGIAKFSPLADWTHGDVWGHIRRHGVPYNALHDRGFPSIGCAPCTRAIGPGEDPRAGRWWWERDDRRECGLHPRTAPSPAARPLARAAP